VASQRRLRRRPTRSGRIPSGLVPIAGRVRPQRQLRRRMALTRPNAGSIGEIFCRDVETEQGRSSFFCETMRSRENLPLIVMSAVSAATLIFSHQRSELRAQSRVKLKLRVGATCRYCVSTASRPIYPQDFVEPCLPRLAANPPNGLSWVHEIKHGDCRLTWAKRHPSWRTFEGLGDGNGTSTATRSGVSSRAERAPSWRLDRVLDCGGLGMDQSRSARNHRGGRSCQ
jgi:hypothetical protein